MVFLVLDDAFLYFNFSQLLRGFQQSVLSLVQSEVFLTLVLSICLLHLLEVLNFGSQRLIVSPEFSQFSPQSLEFLVLVGALETAGGEFCLRTLVLTPHFPIDLVERIELGLEEKSQLHFFFVLLDVLLEFFIDAEFLSFNHLLFFFY